jgi:hypothetical protein
MNARHWMIGCLIGLASMGSALAADMDANGITATSRTTAADSSSRDAGGSNGGDALGLNRDNSPARHGNDADSSDADAHGTVSAGGSEHGDRVPAPAAPQPTTLGWQSLLPGSIQ